MWGDQFICVYCGMVDFSDMYFWFVGIGIGFVGSNRVVFWVFMDYEFIWWGLVWVGEFNVIFIYRVVVWTWYFICFGWTLVGLCSLGVWFAFSHSVVGSG